MKPVILDVDTGLDDACALLLAARHPELDLKAVTCVGGNVGLDDVVVNTLTVLEAAGRSDVPVAARCRRTAAPTCPGRCARARRRRTRQPRLAPLYTYGGAPAMRSSYSATYCGQPQRQASW